MIRGFYLAGRRPAAASGVCLRRLTSFAAIKSTLFGKKGAQRIPHPTDEQISKSAQHSPAFNTPTAALNILYFNYPRSECR